MTHLEINFPLPAPYKTRLRSNLRTPLILTAVFAIVAIEFRSLMHTAFLRFLIPLLDLVVFAIAVFLQIKLAEKEEVYFITDLKLSPEKVEISYTKKDEQHSLSGSPNEFEFKKIAALGRTGSSYQQYNLEVFYKGQLMVRQYTNNDWTSMKFIEIVHAAQS